MTTPEAPPFDPYQPDAHAPRGPWSFLREAVPGGFSALGNQLQASWLVFFLFSNVFWALHLRGLAGWSSLPNYWGELLTARDLWELVENGGLKNHWSGPWVPIAAFGACLWFLWSGWRLQAGSAGLSARLSAWAWGFLDALLIGALPLTLIAMVKLWFLAKLAGTGIQGLCWFALVAGPLVRLACLSAFFLQWWLCRLGRAAGPQAWRLGGWRALGRHLWDAFSRFWLHPIQWGLLVAVGVLLRAGLTFLVLFLAWRWGGGTPLRVTVFLLLQVLVVLFNAWQLGWFLRLVGLFWRHDAAVVQAIRQLQAASLGGGSGSVQ
jgi:hypothetical protein